MTDPSWIVRKVDQLDACGNMHGAVPCKTLVVFCRRITKQPVLIPTLQVRNEGKGVTAYMQVIYTWAHQTTQLTGLPLKRSAHLSSRR